MKPEELIEEEEEEEIEELFVEEMTKEESLIETGMAIAMTFPTTQKVLNDPGFWVADTGASVHMTAHKEGLYDIKKG